MSQPYRGDVPENTLHNKVMQDAKKNPNAIQGDFIAPNPLVDFKPADVVRHRTASSGNSVTSTATGGPAWPSGTSSPKTGPLTTRTVGKTRADWRAKCGYCHVVGFDKEKLTLGRTECQV